MLILTRRVGETLMIDDEVTEKYGINTGDQVMINTDPSRKIKIDNKLQYEPSMAIIGLLPVALVAWVLTLIFYFILP